jgi:hypothetical protein
MHLPHRVEVTIVTTFPNEKAATALEREMREIMGRGELRWQLDLVSDRPAMPERRGNTRLWKAFSEVAEAWNIPLEKEGSAWPSLAGLVPASAACLCGVGPVARDLRTPNEAVRRLSLMQRTLLLAEYLAREAT